MSLHLVHADAAGQLAVVAVLLDPGPENALVRQLWKHLPKEEGPEERHDDVRIHASDLLPKNHGYYAFDGSLTTPPCTENVTWLVLKLVKYDSDPDPVHFPGRDEDRIFRVTFFWSW